MWSTSEPDSSEATIIRNADMISKFRRLDLGRHSDGLHRPTGAVIRDEAQGGRNRQDQAVGRRIKGWLPWAPTFKITKISNWDNNNLPIHVEGTVDGPFVRKLRAQRMLTPLEMFQAEDLSSFTSQKRVNPIYFPFPTRKLMIYASTCPRATRRQASPPVKKLDLGAAFYSISAEAQDDTVEVKRDIARKASFSRRTIIRPCGGFSYRSKRTTVPKWFCRMSSRRKTISALPLRPAVRDVLARLRCTRLQAIPRPTGSVRPRRRSCRTTTRIPTRSFCSTKRRPPSR